MKKTFEKISAILIIMCSALLLQSCGIRTSLNSSSQVAQTSVRSIDNGNVRVAFVVPLSGKDAKTGRSLLDAAQMAVHDGKIEGITLYPIDSQSRSSINSIRDKNVHLIVGPLYGSNALMIHNMVQNNAIPVFSFSNDGSLGGKEGLYLLGISVRDQVNSILGYANSNGYKKIFTVTDQSRYGSMARDAAQNAVGHSGIVESYEYNERDNVAGFSSIASDIYSKIGDDKTKKYAVLFPSSDSKLLEFATSMQLHEIDAESRIPLLGSIQWDNPRIYRGQSSLLAGSYFPSLSHKHMQEFRKSFGRNFGYQPSDVAALGYDSMMMISQILDSLKSNQKGYIDYNIVHNQSFSDMLTGIISINPDGTLRRKLSVRKIN